MYFLFGPCDLLCDDYEDDDEHDDADDLTMTLILCMVAESPRGFLFRLAASIRSSSGSASISTIGLLFRP